MSGNKRVFRASVAEGNEPKVTVTVPLGLVRLARVGGIANWVSARHGIDLDEIVRGSKEIPDGTMVDVINERSSDHVEIYLQHLVAMTSRRPTRLGRGSSLSRNDADIVPRAAARQERRVAPRNSHPGT